ncbi:MAG: tRNA uridine-5-carboxymethylaminomethyl(34) synthesis GTPase MnmE [Candidatus Omnitrophica bacterium]|nr:tRNA uridine-5-carboxymethylaminomethyl(34) synthesis GTPase MnmE [Candidatus Omnitrophota bacterium]MDD5654600.1 tRNA uridine-5-carboxymethylaminomethyl(34) synthesis GTPase MnmE [Candidatus Omnitrophota bacterium]
MRGYNTGDTIAAISTPPGESGIGIIRISGKDALPLADKIFAPKKGPKPSTAKTHTLHYGHITKPGQGIIDEVILTVMRAPRSYTKEDIVEINCHGGIVSLRAVLDRVLENGCRLAEPGEFTMRAFLNGRLDLSQAEAVLDIIQAKTDSALRAGLNQLKGAISARINGIRKGLLEALAVLEANIDFPEEDITPPDHKQTRLLLDSANNSLKLMIEDSRFGRVLRDGIKTVICGRANVGKSSLLNALLKTERSIVTPIAGTTRDTIEEILDIKGIPVRIVDTAGIIEPRDLIEKKAVRRSRKYIETADLIILLFDGSKKISSEDKALMKKVRSKVTIAVINKTDLPLKVNRKLILGKFRHTLDISAKKNRNINLLEDKIAQLVLQGRIIGSDSVLTANSRQIHAIKEAQKLIAQAINSLDNGLTAECVAEDIKSALTGLDEILGKRFSQELLNKIFSEFCIGK